MPEYLMQQNVTARMPLLSYCLVETGNWPRADTSMPNRPSKPVQTATWPAAVMLDTHVVDVSRAYSFPLRPC